MMKISNINKGLLSKLAIVFFFLAALSCKQEDNPYGDWDNASLDAVITEAETLLANNQDGLNPGEYKPGSIKELQDATDWAIWKKEHAKAQSEIEHAGRRLQTYIDRFLGNVITLANPWIQQENDTWIQISDNIKPVLAGEFSIEIECYVINLATKGHSNNLFSSEQMGPDAGFAVRYYSGGKIQIVVGNNNWVDTGEQAPDGTMKDGEWMNVAMTNTGSIQKLYVNGAFVAQNENTHLPTNSEFPLVIGNSPQWTDRVCNTMVREFRVWSKVLDDDAIAANTTATFDGTEDGLECYFPFNADLGTEFSDVTGNYKATLKGNVTWLQGGIPPEIEFDYTLIDQAIADATTLMGEVVEGTNNGDHPVGTIAYIQSLIDDANDTKTNATRQDQLDGKAEDLQAKLAGVRTTLVADADGVYVDRDNPDAIGFRITPNYTPQGNYTVEFEVSVKTLAGYGTGEFFNNGEMGIWVYGFTEFTEEAILNSGGLRNFTSGPNGWEMGPTAPPLTIVPDNWHHVAVTHDEDIGGHAITIMYVDGVETGRDSIAVPNVSGWGEIWLGNGWGKMHGSIKNFRMWNEVRTDLNANITGTEPNLEIYFPLDRVAGVGFKDETGNYDGEMRGIEWNTN